jgi:hypothetical protein
MTPMTQTFLKLGPTLLSNALSSLLAVSEIEFGREGGW